MVGTEKRREEGMEGERGTERDGRERWGRGDGKNS